MAENRELTDREREILERVATGASNRQVAQQLHISSNTVKVHLRNIFEKLGVSSRTEATLYAIQAGMVNGVKSTLVAPARPWWQRGWVIAGGALALTMVALLVGILVNPGESPSENIVDLEQLERERWQELAPMPTARKGLAVTAYDGKIYAIAGETVDGVTDVVERYDPATDTWETLSPKPTAVTDVQAALIGGKIYVPGGRLDSGELTEAVEVYDVQAGAWESVDDLPQPLSGYAIASYEGKVYLFGGTNNDESQPTVWSYDAETDDWEPGESMPIGRSGAGLATVSGGILLAGGESETGPTIRVQLYQPDREGISESAWSDRSDLLFTGEELNAVGFGDILYIFGASDAEGRMVIQEYINQNDTWQAQRVPLPNTWLELRVTQLGHHLFLIGGQIDGGLSPRMVRYQAVYTVLLPIIQ